MGKDDRKSVHEAVAAMAYLKELNVNGVVVVGSYHQRWYAPLMARSYPMYRMMPELRVVGDTVMASGLLPDEEVVAQLHRSLGPRAKDWVVPNHPEMHPSAAAIDVVSCHPSFLFLSISFNGFALTVLRFYIPFR